MVASLSRQEQGQMDRRYLTPPCSRPLVNKQSRDVRAFPRLFFVSLVDLNCFVLLSLSLSFLLHRPPTTTRHNDAMASQQSEDGVS